MAVIKAINSKSSVGSLINYVADKDKTSEVLMYGKDCSSNPNQAIDDMKMTKEIYNKEHGRQYKHFVQSFDPKDKITPEKANLIGREWAEKNFKGYEVFIATHKDKKHIHNHFVVNSVNFEDGRKLVYDNKQLAEFKKVNDLLCEREGLHITEPKKDVLTSFNSKKYKALEKGYKTDYKSHLFELWRNVKSSCERATSKEQFIENMKEKGYGVTWKDTRKYVTFTPPEGKPVRDETLAKTFKNENLTKEGLLNEFERNGKELSIGEALDGIHGKTQEDSRATTKEIDGTGKEDIRTREQIRENGDIETELGTGSRRTDNKEQNNELSKKVEDKPKIDKDDEFMQQYLEQQRRRSLAQKRDREKARRPGQRRTKNNDFEI